ncbi:MULTISPECIES: aldo/keto reductase [Halocynthiibacter]|uniref:Aldo/keto reductase n=1 Tax=Halocynthiibacter halioticoli TaxID=2986804 RepID=A0AAE3LQG4_9RHOB|nr:MULTISPECIES: aldo/keto reductase [Halocynthiibacter]MCV6823483.1 aldo/keto reductase [Halocynthiibacter halioticoli]MCW4056484.1 aldo/keto reductase [Halocynthiibacter sp. SDUM655004]
MTKLSLPERTLASGALSLPVLGFGGAPLGGLLQANDNTAAREMMARTRDVGYRYYDTAPFYGFGRSERMVGDAIRDTDYILSTKVGRLMKPGLPADAGALGWPDALPFHQVFDYGYDAIMRSFEDSLQRLGLDRIDMLLVHDIGEMTHGEDNARHFKDLEQGGYRALDELRKNGQIKAIGIGVNETKVCRDCLKIGDWDAFLLAGRYTLLEQGSLDDLLPECEEAKTSIILGGPYNSGILAGGDTWNYGAAPEDVVARVKRLKATAQDHGVPLAAAALQFPLAHPLVASVIPGLRNTTELDQTLEWAFTDIPEAFWSDLRAQGLLHEQAPTPTSTPYKKG